jgi:hypothetical protein
MTDAKKPAVSLSKQINALMEGLARVRSNRTDPRYAEVVRWVQDFPEHARPDGVFETIARAFSVTIEEAKKSVSPSKQQNRPSFENLIPHAGWLADYVHYTRTTEPPSVFHFFVGAVTLGAVLRRNIHFAKGYANLYPNLCVVLVAPSGKCRKTTACELGIKLYRDMGGTVLADKITPEALVDAFGDKEEATGLIFAGELKQFLGSQKYMEGMIPLLTRLFDCPDLWSSRTIARDEIILRNVGISMLGASTMDWLRMLPGDTFGGGFMSRLLLVVQEDTPRSFPIPPPMDERLRTRLMTRLMELQGVHAKMHMTPNAEEWYREWYNKRDDRGTDEKLFAGYYERKPDHLLRLSMILSVAEDSSFILELRHMKHSLEILNWTESWLPAAFEQLSSTNIGEDVMRMIGQLKKANGTLKHSDWLRKNSNKMHAAQFKGLIATLREAKLVDFDGISYYLTPDGWKR